MCVPLRFTSPLNITLLFPALPPCTTSPTTVVPDFTIAPVLSIPSKVTQVRVPEIVVGEVSVLYGTS